MREKIEGQADELRYRLGLPLYYHNSGLSVSIHLQGTSIWRPFRLKVF